MADQEKVIIPMPKGLKVMRANEVVDAWGLNMVLFGIPGAGKTALAATAQDSPYGADVLFIDVEGGTRTIADRKDITVFKPDTFSEVREMYDWIVDAGESGGHSFKTIVIDTLPELQRIGLKEILSSSKNPDWPGIQDWGKSTEQMMAMVRAFRGLSQGHGYNIIFTAHANEQKDEVTGAVMVRPNLTPKATEMVCGAVDVVGYLSRNPAGVRELRLEPTNTIMAKYRQPRSGVQLPTVIQDPNLVSILEHLRNTGG
jgi:phage nucleotide-binding protein